MCASYARQHQKKLQFVQNQFSSVGGSARQRLSSEERRHLLSDKEAYIEYLENQLDKVCELSLVENPQIQKRVQELEQSITDHEEKFVNITKLIKLLQTFAENQEDENKLIKQHFNKPLNSFGKKIENFQNDLVGELKDQIIKIEEKDNQRDTQIYDTLSAFQKNINDFEVRIEQFANQLSKDMATDIKTLANQIQGESSPHSAAAPQSDQLRYFPTDEKSLKQNLDKFREEVNKKIEFVLKEMRKNALLSDVENVETKIKKEQKERTYLCKFVEDLTRKIDELPQSITTRASTSRNVSPSAVQESNQFKLVKQIESDIEDLKEVVNALVDKLEDQDKKKKSSAFITKEQFENLEKTLSSQISRVLDRYQGHVVQNIPYDESLRESADNQRNQHNLSARQQYSALKSDQYLTQQMRSPQFEQQMWQQQQQHQGNNQSAEIHPEDDSYMMQQKYSQMMQDDQDLRETLISKKEQMQNTTHQEQSGGDNNLGESFGLNQNSHISNNLSSKMDKSKNLSSKRKSKQEETLDQFPQKEKRGSSSSKSIISNKENKQNSNSLNRGRKSIDESVNTLKKNKKRELKSESRSVSKSPSNIGEVSSTKSINAPRKISHQNISIDGKQKSNSRITMTEPEESRVKSPLPTNQYALLPSSININLNYFRKIKNSFDSSHSKPKSKNKSPSPLNVNKLAEKKRQNGEKIKELFKKKKQMDQNTSSNTNINQSVSQKSINTSVHEKKTGEKKKK